VDCSTEHWTIIVSEKKKTDTGFTAAEKTAMKERAKELMAKQTREESTKAQLQKIAEFPQPDRGFAEHIHAIVTATSPSLAPKLWYGMPGYAKDGKILCFFQPASKFEARYATFGFNDVAELATVPADRRARRRRVEYAGQGEHSFEVDSSTRISNRVLGCFPRFVGAKETLVPTATDQGVSAWA